MGSDYFPKTRGKSQCGWRQISDLNSDPNSQCSKALRDRLSIAYRQFKCSIHTKKKAIAQYFKRTSFNPLNLSGHSIRLFNRLKTRSHCHRGSKEWAPPSKEREVGILLLETMRL